MRKRPTAAAQSLPVPASGGRLADSAALRTLAGAALGLLLVFGPKRLPEMGRSLGRGMREFKDSVGGMHKPEELASPVETTAAARDEHETTV